MSNCKYETSNGRCGLKGSYAYRHKCFTEDLCKCHEPMTNAQKIRAMSDEELAEYIAGIIDDANSGSVIYSNRKEEWLEWLKQPAEVD